ncbi:MAG TPA: hypothetical protein VFA48_13585 [Gammaproteobacteria bacterium]|nr:hypothetical protein [Gammaproteobacteria bacterium]
MADHNPFWPQAMTPSRETLWDQWHEAQQSALEYVGRLIALGAQGYQDGWRLSTGFIRELSGSPRPGSTSRDVETPMDYGKRAQALFLEQLEEMQKLNDDWWSNICSATRCHKKSAPRPESGKRKTGATGAARE